MLINCALCMSWVLSIFMKPWEVTALSEVSGWFPCSFVFCLYLLILSINGKTGEYTNEATRGGCTEWSLRLIEPVTEVEVRCEKIPECSLPFRKAICNAKHAKHVKYVFSPTARLKCNIQNAPQENITMYLKVLGGTFRYLKALLFANF